MKAWTILSVGFGTSYILLLHKKPFRTLLTLLTVMFQQAKTLVDAWLFYFTYTHSEADTIIDIINSNMHA